MTGQDGWVTDHTAPAHGLPHALALLWGLVPEPQRGPRRGLSIDQIAGAAVAIANEDGLEAVSMARVAKSLGYTTMSLYRYVTGKDDLLLLMLEVTPPIEFPEPRPGDGWRSGLDRWTRYVVEVYRAQPWRLDVPVSGPPITPANLRVADAALGAMADLPLDDEEKLAVLMVLTGYAHSAAKLERDLGRPTVEPTEAAAVAAALGQFVTPERYPHLAPVVASGAYFGDGQPSAGDADVDFGLERILDGVAVYVAEKGAS